MNFFLFLVVVQGEKFTVFFFKRERDREKKKNAVSSIDSVKVHNSFFILF